jgi:hypothetical protein
VNVSDVPFVVWVVVAGDDITLYDVAPKPAVHDRGMLVPETDPITKLDGAADVYAFPDVTGDAYAPMELAVVIVNVYSDAASRPVNVYDVALVVWVVVAGVDVIEYDVAFVPAVHESEMLGFDVELVCEMDETGPAGGNDVYVTFVLDAP